MLALSTGVMWFPWKVHMHKRQKLCPISMESLCLAKGSCILFCCVSRSTKSWWSLRSGSARRRMSRASECQACADGCLPFVVQPCWGLEQEQATGMLTPGVRLMRVFLCCAGASGQSSTRSPPSRRGQFSTE